MFNLMILMVFMMVSSTISSTDIIIKTFDDNLDGNILSRDQDHGWRVYPNGDKYYIDDYCENEQDCKVTDGINTYYGPYKKEKKYLGRNFACDSDSLIDISYQVIFCDATTYTTKDFTKLEITNIDTTTPHSFMQTDKHYIDISSPIYDSSLDDTLNNDILPDNCASGNWKIMTISDEIEFEAFADKPFEVLFVFKLNKDTHFGFITNIKIFCNNQELTQPPFFDQGVSHGNKYCISDITSDINANGEYIVRTDHNEEPIQENGENAFEKNDPNGKYYLFEQYDEITFQQQWHVSKVLGDADQTGTNLIASCHIGDVNQGVHYDELETFCNTEFITIKSGPCIAHTTIGSLFTLFSNNNMYILLISLSILSCIFGMITCYCCQLICAHHKTKNYKKVSDKEDIDIDF